MEAGANGGRSRRLPLEVAHAARRDTLGTPAGSARGVGRAPRCDVLGRCGLLPGPLEVVEQEDERGASGALRPGARSGPGPGPPAAREADGQGASGSVRRPRGEGARPAATATAAVGSAMAAFVPAATARPLARTATRQEQDREGGVHALAVLRARSSSADWTASWARALSGGPIGWVEYRASSNSRVSVLAASGRTPEADEMGRADFFGGARPEVARPSVARAASIEA